jgi:long-chain acyl-CoA synthetase
VTLTPELVHEAVRRLTAADGIFAVTEQQLAGVPQRVFTHAAPTVLDILTSGRGYTGADFLVFGDQRWSFEQFFADVDALAAVLQHDMGVKPGDRMAIAMRNCPDWILTFAAAVHVGAVAVLINSWGSAEELEFTLRDSDPTVLAADLPRTRLATDALRQRRTAVLFSDVDGDAETLGRDSLPHLAVWRIRDAVTAGRGREYATVQREPEDMAMLLYTSGSTGHPKGVVYCHVSAGQALMHMMLVGFLALEFGGPIELRGGATSEAQLVTVPLFHATGLFSGFLLPCAVGQKVVLLRKWDAVTAMQTIQTEKVTMLSTVPAILKDLLTHPRFDDFDLSSISRVAAAGAATPTGLPELLRDKLGIENRSSGYGMTETASVCATMSGPVFDLKPMAAGIVSPIIDLRVVGVQGNALPSDLGNIDDDGFLHLTGRIKEIVIRGGENIAPIEIENVAYRHPLVKEVAVFGVPDDLMGEELAMVCHRQPGSALTEDELRQHMLNGLPTFKVPKYLALTDKPLPRNASEKIHRLALRDGFVAN